MCEIPCIFLLCRKVGEILREKGRNPIGFQIMAVLLWIMMELLGAIVGWILVLSVFQIDPQKNPGGFYGVVGGGLIGGILVSVMMTFMIIGMVPNRHTARQYGPPGMQGGLAVPSAGPVAVRPPAAPAGPYQYLGPVQPMPKGMNIGAGCVVKCPFCQMMVAPQADGACPACRNRIA